MTELKKELALYAYPERYCVRSGQTIAFRIGIERRNPKNSPRLPATAAESVWVDRYEVRNACTDEVVATQALRRWCRPRVLRIDYQGCRSFDKNGCEFPARLEWTVPAELRGTHYLLLKDKRGEMTSERAYFTVRSDRPKSSLVLMHPTFTWQAYNPMGGQSFYYPTGYRMDELRTVSLLRPIAAATPFHHHPESAVVFERALKEAGLPFDTIDSYELHSNEGALDGYEVLLLTSHDEYMTARMRASIDEFVDRGGKVGVFSGNTGWYKVRLNDKQMEIVYGPYDQSEPLTERTGQWDFDNIAYPIEASLGLSYTFGGFPVGRRHDEGSMRAAGLTEEEVANVNGYRCLEPSHPLFAGSNLVEGDWFGSAADLMYVEIDGLPRDGKGAIDRHTAPAAPKQCAVLAEGYVSTYLEHEIRCIPVIIEMTRGRGRVVHLGSIGWCRALNRDPRCKQIFLNAVRYLQDQLNVGPWIEAVDVAEEGDDVTWSPLSNQDPIVQVEHPVVIHGMSRSGTTLLNVMLDAHPDIAMSFDVTPNRMSMDVSALADLLHRTIEAFDVRRLADLSDSQYFQTFLNLLGEGVDADGQAVKRFMLVCRRSQLSPVIVWEALQNARDYGVSDMSEDVERLRVGAFVVEAKRAVTGRGHAGAKIIYPPEKVIEVYPRPKYLLIIRDPRDVYASHVRVGWEADPAHIARGWRVRVERLRQLESDPRFDVLHVPFEKLIESPSEWSQRICRFLDVSHYDVADRYSESAGVFRVSEAFDEAEHLFWTQGGLERGRVGHWNSLISRNDAEIIANWAGDEMAELGYS